MLPNLVRGLLSSSARLRRKQIAVLRSFSTTSTSNLITSAREHLPPETVVPKTVPISLARTRLMKRPVKSATDRITSAFSGLLESDLGVSNPTCSRTRIRYSTAIKKLDKQMRKALFAHLDDYSRFVYLISQNPVDVPLETILQLYQRVQNITAMERVSLNKILIFHNAWADYWACNLAPPISILDIESILDQVRDCLYQFNNRPLGIWFALEAGLEASSNGQISRTITDAFKNKFELSAKQMDRFLAVLCTTSTVIPSKNPCNSLLAYEVYKVFQSIEDADARLAFIKSSFKSNPQLWQISGLISQILSLPHSQELVKFFTAPLCAVLNDRDFEALLREMDPSQIYQLHLAFHRNHRKKLITASLLIARFVMVAYHQGSPTFPQLILKFQPHLNLMSLCEMLPFLLQEKSGQEALRQIRRQRPKDFLSLLNKVVHWGPRFQREATSAILHACEGCERRFLRVVLLQLKHIPLEDLLKMKLDQRGLMEVWTYALRHDRFETHTLGQLFQLILKQVFKKKQFERRMRIAGISSFHSDDLQAIFDYTTSSERFHFVSCIHQMARTASKRSAGQISRLLNCLNGFLNSSHSTFISGELRRRHVMRLLISHIFDSIHRRDQSEKAMRKMKDINVDFASKDLQAAALRHAVIAHPHKAMETINYFERKKMPLIKPLMSAIEQGILQNPWQRKYNLTTSETEWRARMNLFHEFQSRKLELGYETRITRKTLTYYGDLAHEILSARVNRATAIADWDLAHMIFQSATNRGVARRVLRRWKLRRAKARNNALGLD